MKNISYTNFHIFSLIIMWCVYMYINVSNQFFLTLTSWSPPTPPPPLKSSVGMTCNPSQSNKIRQPCLTQLSHFLWAWNGDMNKWPFTSGLNKYISTKHIAPFFEWVNEMFGGGGHEDGVHPLLLPPSDSVTFISRKCINFMKTNWSLI